MRSSGPINGEWIYPRLLVVEDNPLNQRLAERVLVKMNFCVDVVGNGEEAVAAVRGRNYLAILMDCQMPVMDGFEATLAIRSMGGLTSQTPIIAMTAFDTTETRERCDEVGMNAFAAKPVDWSNIEKLLRTTAAGKTAELASLTDHSNTDQMPSDAAVLNLDVLMRIADDHGGPEAIAELVRLFRRESTELFDRLGLALSAGDIDESERLCTELRGTVSSIGAERLAGLMSDVDRMIGDDRINDAVRSADRFWDELGLVLDELDRSLAWARSAAATTNTAHARGTVDSSTAQSAAEYSPTAAAPAAWPAPTVDSLVSVG